MNINYSYLLMLKQNRNTKVAIVFNNCLRCRIGFLNLLRWRNWNKTTNEPSLKNAKLITLLKIKTNFKVSLYSLHQVRYEEINDMITTLDDGELVGGDNP